MRVKLYIEGGGDRSSLHIKCREGFRKLLERAGFQDRMPSTKACGNRSAAYDDFKTALHGARDDDYPVLLVDSEGPVSQPPWQHLRSVMGGNDPPLRTTTRRNSWSNAWRVGASPTEPLCGGFSATIFARTPCRRWTILKHAKKRQFKKLLSTRHAIVDTTEAMRKENALLSFWPSWIRRNSRSTCRTLYAFAGCLIHTCESGV